MVTENTADLFFVMMDEADTSNKPFYPFQELIETSNIIFYHCSLEDNFPLLYISENVRRILGFAQNEFEQNNSLWIHRIHPQDKEEVLQNFNKVFNREAFVSEFRFKHKEGCYIWLRDEVKLVRDDTGEPQSIVGSSIDITERKKAEQEVQKLNETLEKRIEERTKDLTVANEKLKKQIAHRKEAENQLLKQQEKLKLLQMAVANINDMVIITKVPIANPLDSRIVFVNNAFEKHTGYSFEEVKSKDPVFLHGPETSSRAVENIKASILNHEPVRTEFVNYKKNGEPYWVELDISPFPAGDDVHEFWVGINRNITERKETEKVLEESEHRYRAYAELSFDAIFEITLDGTITDCNARACEIFGYSRKELIGKHTKSLTPDKHKDSQPDIISDKVTTGHEAWERIYKRKDGTLIPTEINTKIYKRGDEKRVIAYVRDISEHKKYEAAIKESLKEKETLLAEIHHRVKNNLAIISGLLEMQTYNAKEEGLVNSLKESQSRIQSIAMVHEKLYQSDSFNNIPIDTYIDDLFYFISNTFEGKHSNVEVKKDIDAISLNVSQAIPCGLILNELITNAYKHAFEEVKNPQIHIALHQTNSHVELRVKDNGNGLPDDFETSHPSSLGTTLIQTLVQQLNGKLEAFSDNGACFSIRFEVSSRHSVAEQRNKMED